MQRSQPVSPALFSPQAKQRMMQFTIHFGVSYLGTSWKAKQKVIKHILKT